MSNKITLKQRREWRMLAVAGESQLAAEHAATLIAKSGKQTLERTAAGRYCVTDGWLTDWVIFYNGPWVWAHDGTLQINKPLRDRLNSIAEAREVQS